MAIRAPIRQAPALSFSSLGTCDFDNPLDMGPLSPPITIVLIVLALQDALHTLF